MTTEMTTTLDNTDTQMDGNSLNISEQRKKELKQLFPNVFTETKNDQGEVVETLDFERLKAELGEFSEIYDNRRERYGMDWPGKRDCLRLIQEPSTATLKPCREESVDFDTTENLFIEGDNLEVLKLLQKSYYGKVKMIYIDPPYNTGKEFIYPDNFSENLDTYLEYAGLKETEGEGRKWSSNSQNEGRFHTKWLNMMFPRLYLARNLLKEDGVIFISIDDNEVENLRRMCDEIFGEENFVGQVSRATGTRMGSGSRGISRELDYVLVYTRNHYVYLNKLPMTDEEKSLYNEVDDKGRYVLRSLRRTGGENRREDRPSMFFPIAAPDGEKILPLAPEGWESRWVCNEETYFNLTKENEIVWKKVAKDGQEQWKVYQKIYMSEDGRDATDLWNGIEGNKKATRQVTSLFKGVKIFDHPKPIEMICRAIMQATNLNNEDIVLDFFCGSGSTGHAVYYQNSFDHGGRKYILIQLPEVLEEKSNAYKNGYRTIADVAKERIRRAGSKIRLEADSRLGLENTDNQDLGFKVLKLDQSNFKQWQAPEKDISDEELIKQFELNVDHIDPNASQEDLLYELLIKAGVMPTETIEQVELANHKLFSVAEDSLLIHLGDEIDQDLIDAVIKKAPGQFICLDKAFHGNDQLKANAVKTIQAFNQGKDEVERIDFKTV